MANDDGADFDLVDEPEAKLAPAIIPYIPRPHFRALHASTKRWIFAVAHRRAGKTVALVNQLIRAALSNPRRHPPPRYAYVGPSFDQVKDLCWAYLKYYAGGYPGVRFLEGELTVIFPHGATIRLYGGGQAYERIRGIYLDGAVLDEYPLLNARAWTSVVRPTLADYRGFAVISGTSNGDDHFHAVKLKAEDDPAWDVFDIKITDTGEDALKYEEQRELTRDMPADEYAREMLNAFDAPVEGAYYTESLNSLQTQHRITSVPVNLSGTLITGWDIGIHDFTCIWVFQLVGKAIHFVDYIEDRGHKAEHYLNILDQKAKSWGVPFKAHILPHDVEAREWISGESRRFGLIDATPTPILTADRVSDADGVSAVRGILGISWFDEQRCRRGLARLRGYKKSKFGTPVHDDHSHGADALKTVAVGLPHVTALSSSLSFGRRLRRRIRGLV
jgi:phage terminase large subunit